MSKKEILISDIIALNPTGTLNFTGTYTMNGQNNIVINSNSKSKDSLEKTQNNKLVCDAVEKFENYNNKDIKNYYKEYFLIFIILLIIFLLFIFIFIYKK